MAKKNIIAIATAYTIYEIKEDVMQMLSAQAMLMPPAVVMDTLVMQGLAKVVARIKPYDLEEDHETSIKLAEEYDPEAPDEEDPHETPPDLLFPWYDKPKGTEEDEEEDE